MASMQPHWGRAAIAGLMVSIITVGGYLVRPNSDPGVAVGMALACAAVLAAFGFLYWISHRAPGRGGL
jgi:hypothetical protein